MGGPAAHRRIAALALSLASLSLVAAGCGAHVGEQDRTEPAGNFQVRLLSAKFPNDQSLAKDTRMQISVQNAGTHRVPDISVTVHCPGKGLGGSFMTAVDESDVSDPQRPQFIVDKIPTRQNAVRPALDPAPLERSSALVDTYPLGPLQPNAKVTFTWNVTAVKAGPYRLCWRVNAGLYGKAHAVPSSDSRPLSGEFVGSVSNKPPRARIAADGHTVIGSSASR